MKLDQADPGCGVTVMSTLFYFEDNPRKFILKLRDS